MTHELRGVPRRCGCHRGWSAASSEPWSQHGPGTTGRLVDHGHLVTERRAAFSADFSISHPGDFARDRDLGVGFRAHDGQSKVIDTADSPTGPWSRQARRRTRGHDDVGVAVTVELDAQSHLTSSSRAFSNEASEAESVRFSSTDSRSSRRATGLSLLGVGAARVEQGLSASRSSHLSTWATAAEAGGAATMARRCPQTQNVEAQDRDHDEQAREERGHHLPSRTDRFDGPQTGRLPRGHGSHWRPRPMVRRARG